MTYQQAHAAMQDPALRARAYIAIIEAARKVFQDDVSGTTTAYDLRRAWAKLAISGEVETHQRLLHLLITAGNFAAITADDAALQTYVDGRVTFLARMAA